jgi:hypothetical protein
MTARYLLTITDEDAVRLERWLGGQLVISPVLPGGLTGEILKPFTGDVEPVTVAGLNAITDKEYKVIARRLRTGGPLYHAGERGGSFTCPACGMTSYHPDDVANSYCGNCHEFTSLGRGPLP